MIETPKIKVDFDVLPVDAVRSLHERFMKGIEEKVVKALPEDAPDYDVRKLLLKELLLATARKAIELRPETLTRLAKEGHEAIVKAKRDADASLHSAQINEWSSYPSPGFSPEQEKKLHDAAAKRREDDAVKQLFEGQDRLYLKIKQGIEAPKSRVHQDIDIYLSLRGYKISDYVGGYATDAAGKQQFRIGKLLKDTKFYQPFTEDASRTLGNLVVVVSRKAEDIARMSTGRAWGSCMGSGGFNFKYVPKDIEKGTMIAYLISEKDPDIKNPLARILIKPFVEKKGTLGALTAAAMKVFGVVRPMETIYVPDKTYGIHNEAFTAAVHKFVEDKLNASKEGKFVLPAGLYADGTGPAYVRQYGRMQETYR